MNEQETKKLLNRLIVEQVDQVLSEVVLKEEYEDPLAQVFLQPFKDVVDTARHGLEKTTAKVWGNTAKLAKQAATLLIPGIPVDAFTKDADEKIKSRLGEIDSKYKDVIQRNYDMMRSRDLWGVPFLLNPALMTGVEMASHAPVVVLSTLEALTGGNPTITKMRERANTITQRVRGGGFTGGKGGGSFGESSRNSVKAFREQQEPQQPLSLAQVNKSLGKQIENVLKHPTIQNAIKNSELSKQLRQIGIDSMLSTVQDAISFSSYDEMKQKMSSNPNFAAIEADFMKNLPEGATEQQVAELKNALVGEMKSVIKQVYTKQLEKLLSQSPDMKKELSGLAKQIQAL